MAKPSDISIKIDVDNKQAERALKSLQLLFASFQRMLDANDKKQAQQSKKKITRIKREVSAEKTAAKQKEGLTKREIQIAKAAENLKRQIRHDAIKHTMAMEGAASLRRRDVAKRTAAAIATLEKKGIKLNEAEKLRIKRQFIRLNQQIELKKAREKERLRAKEKISDKNAEKAKLFTKQQVDKKLEVANRKAARLHERLTKKAVREAVRAEREKVRATQRSEKEQARLRRQSSKAAAVEVRRRLRNHKKATQETIRMAKQQNDAFRRINSSISSIGDRISSGLVFALEAATLAVVALGAATVKIGADFEQAVTTLGAIRGQTGADLKPFEEQARLLGETTAFTATEAARGMQELARAGMQTSDIIASSNDALKFAGANATDMTTSTTLLAATMAQFGLNASQSTRVVDTFTSALQNSLLNVETLQVAMRYAGSVGASFGRSFEETVAMVALFRDLGLEGSTAGTQFRQAFVRLSAPTKKAQKVLEQYGLSLDDVNPKINTFQEILETLADTGIGDDLPAIKELVSIRAAGSFAKILKDVTEGTSKLSFLQDKFRESAGTTDKTYDAMINTVSGQTAILKSVIEETFLRIFDLLTLDGVSSEDNPIIRILESLQTVFRDLNIAIEGFAGRLKNLISTRADQFIGSIENNSEALGAALILLIESIIKIIAKLFEWRSEIALVIKSLLALSAAAASIAFTSGTAAIATMISKMGNLVVVAPRAAAAIKTFAAALTGPVGLIIAITTAVASFALISVAQSKFIEEQRRIALAIKANKEGIEDFGRSIDALIGNITSLQVTSKDVGTELIENLRTDPSVSAATFRNIQQEIGAVERLTEAQAREKFERGELIKVTTVFGEALLSQNAITKLATTTTGQLLQVEEQRTQEIRRAKSASEVARRKLDELIQSRDEAVRTSQKNATAEKVMRGLVEERTIAVEKQEAIYVKLRDRYKSLVRAEASSSQQLEREIALTRESIDLNDGRADTLEEVNEGLSEQVDLLELLNSALQDRLDLEAEIDAATLAASGNKNEQAVASEQDRIKAIETVFTSELALRGRFDEETLKLNQILAERIAQDRANRNQEELNELEKQLEQIRSKRLDSVETVEKVSEAEIAASKKAFTAFLRAELVNEADVQEKLDIAYRERTAAIQDAFDARQITEEESYNKLREAAADYLQSKERLQAESDERVEQRSRVAAAAQRAIAVNATRELDKLNQEYAKNFNKVNVENINSLSDFLAAAEQLQKDAAQVTADRFDPDKPTFSIGTEILEENADLQSQILDGLINSYSKYEQESKSSFVQGFNELRKNLDKLDEFQNSSNASRIKFAKALIGFRFAQKEAAEFIAETVEKLPSGFKEIAKSLGAIRRGFDSLIGIDTIIDDLNKLRSGDIKGFALSFLSLEKLKSAAKDAVKLITAIGVQAGKAAVALSKLSLDKLKSGLSFLTGGANFNPFEIINDSLTTFTKLSEDAAEKQKALQEQLDAGQITQSEFDVASQALQGQGELASPEQAQQFANDFIDKITDRIELIAQVAGPVLQAIADKIPELVQTFISEIPKIVTALADALPEFFIAIVDGLTAVFDTLTEQLSSVSGEAASEFFDKVSEKMVNLLTSISGFITTAIQQIVANLPEIIGSLTEIVNTLLTAIGEIAVTLIQKLPEIITSLLASLTSIINNLGPIVSNIVTAIADMLPDLLTSIAAALPDLIGSLGNLVSQLLISLADAIPRVLTALLNGLPEIVSGLVEGALEFIVVIVEAIPDIIQALIAALPDLIIAIVTRLPRIVIELVALIIRKLPEIAFRLVKAIFIQLPVALVRAARDFAVNFVNGIRKFFRDAIDRIKKALSLGIARTQEEKNAKAKLRAERRAERAENRSPFGDALLELFSDGMAQTNTFGDTPHPLKAGTNGLVARFASGDFVIAAQEPAELMRQSLMAMGSNITGFVDNISSSLQAPSVAPPSFQGGGSQVDIAVMADGRLLDAIQVRAMENGNAPKMSKKIRRSSGASLGFNRGRFNKFGKR